MDSTPLPDGVQPQTMLTTTATKMKKLNRDGFDAEEDVPTIMMTTTTDNNESDKNNNMNNMFLRAAPTKPPQKFNKKSLSSKKKKPKKPMKSVDPTLPEFEPNAVSPMSSPPRSPRPTEVVPYSPDAASMYLPEPGPPAAAVHISQSPPPLLPTTESVVALSQRADTPDSTSIFLLEPDTTIYSHPLPPSVDEEDSVAELFSGPPPPPPAANNDDDDNSVALGSESLSVGTPVYIEDSHQGPVYIDDSHHQDRGAPPLRRPRIPPQVVTAATTGAQYGNKQPSVSVTDGSTYNYNRSEDSHLSSLVATGGKTMLDIKEADSKAAAAAAAKDNWLLFAIVFLSLGWVGSFTIISAHESFRENGFDNFESTYFGGKSGARIMTHLGVFYIWCGTMVLGFLSLGVRLPKPSPRWVRSFKFPIIGGTATRLEFLAFVFFLLIQAAAFIIRVHRKYKTDWPRDEMLYEISKTMGKTLAITMLVLFLPVSKSCFWWDLFNIKFERAVKLHVWLSWFTVLTTLAHAITALASFNQSGQLAACLIPNSNDCTGPKGDHEDPLKASKINLYGLLATVLLLVILVTSLPWVRRNKYEWFYYTHFLFIPFMVLIHWHYPSMIYYSAPSLAAYTLDKVIWYCSTRRPVKIVSLTQPIPGYVRMTLAVEEGFSFTPGQWVNICVPSISVFQWHPMSIASAPGGNTFTIDIKVVGDWTQQLSDLAMRFDPVNHFTHSLIFIDGFHGSSHQEMQGYLTHKAALLFSGGIGITPLLSSLRTLVEARSAGVEVALKRMVFVWVVREGSILSLYRTELAKIQAMQQEQAAQGLDIEVLVYVTMSQPPESGPPPLDDIFTVAPELNLQLLALPPAPLMRSVMGYGHKMLLTFGSGGAFLLGLFLANFITTTHDDWRFEYVILLQLTLSVFAAAFVSFLIMGASWFRPLAIYRGDDRRALKAKDSNLSDMEEHMQLEYIVGRRPDVGAIVQDMGIWCQQHACTSVGVGVCGPEALVDAVRSSSNRATSSRVQFVVDDEAFDW